MKEEIHIVTETFELPIEVDAEISKTVLEVQKKADPDYKRSDLLTEIVSSYIETKSGLTDKILKELSKEQKHDKEKRLQWAAGFFVGIIFMILINIIKHFN